MSIAVRRLARFSVLMLVSLIFFVNTYAQLGSDTLNELLRQGNSFLKEGKYDEAITEYNKAIQNEPQSAVAYHNRGKAYFQKKDWDKAIQDFTKVVEINPKSPPLFYPEYNYLASAYHFRGMAYSEKGSLDEAISDFSKCLESQPNSIEDYYYRGVAYSLKKDHDKSLKDLDKSWDLMDRGVAQGVKPKQEFFTKLSKALGKDQAFESFIAVATPNYSYFNECNDENFQKVELGMEQAEVRKLAGGNKYNANASFSPGLTFNSEEKESKSKIVFKNIPPGIYDFYLSKENLLAVRFDDKGKVIKVKILPLSEAVVKFSGGIYDVKVE